MAVWHAASTRHLTRLKLAAASPSSFIHRRQFAGGADYQSLPKVNFWQDPLSPSRWKREHFVIVSLAGCGALAYGGYKFLPRDKKDEKDEKVAESPK